MNDQTDAVWLLMVAIGFVLLILILTHEPPRRHHCPPPKCHVHPPR